MDVNIGGSANAAGCINNGKRDVMMKKRETHINSFGSHLDLHLT